MKVSITLRTPIFIEVELDMEEQDYEDLVDEWDRMNVGLVNGILSQYVDFENPMLGGVNERVGATEMVDMRAFEDTAEPEEDTSQ